MPMRQAVGGGGREKRSLVSQYQYTHTHTENFKKRKKESYRWVKVK